MSSWRRGLTGNRRRTDSPEPLLLTGFHTCFNSVISQADPPSACVLFSLWLRWDLDPMPKPLRRRCDARLPVRDIVRDRAIRAGELEKYLRRNRCKKWAVRGKKRCRLHGGLSTGPRTPEGKARTTAAMVEGRRRLLEKLKAEGKPVPWGRKRGGVNESAAERQLARASKERARAQRDLKEFLSQKFRRQRRQAREVVKREVERLLAEHEEQRRRLRLPPLSPEQREAVIDGFRQRVAVPSDDGSMPWTDVQVLQDRLREADDALERAQAETAQHKRSARLGRSM